MEVNRSLDDIYGDANAEEKALMHARFMSDMFYFCEHVIGHKYSSFHHDQAKHLFTDRYICIENPIGHGKTTLFSIDYPIWRLYREKQYQISVVSSSMEQQSSSILSILRSTIESNELLSDLLMSNEIWKQTKLLTKNGNQYYIKPFSDSARGMHPNLLVLDDILRAKDITMQEIKDLFWSVFFGRVQRKKGQIILVGTPMDPGDLFDEIEQKKGWVHRRYSAVITDEKGEWLRPLYPEVFTLEELKNIRNNMGELRWQREYMCNPQSGAARAIPHTILFNSLYNNERIGSVYEGVPYTGNDLAASTERTADFSVFIGVDIITGKKEFDIEVNGVKGTKVIENPIIIRNIERYKGLTPPQQRERINFISKAIRSEKDFVDISQWGRMVVLELIADGCNAEGVDFQSMQRRELLRNLISLFASGRIIIPYCEEDSGFNHIEALISELSKLNEISTKTNYLTYGVSSGHDDCIMALAMAVKNISVQKPLSKNVFMSSGTPIIKPIVNI